ncbi:ABC transporter permease [Nisaea sp.]|uniref:ABC transporter permease n=1 Tax=Nisaea sp. TaxID=2024842 RepID=UPI003B530214
MENLSIALKIARRELRGSASSFRVFLACLALGVAAMAGVGSVSFAMMAGVERDAREILGGDVDIRFSHREATQEQEAWFRQSGRVAETVEMRAMARKSDGDRRTLVELKGVSDTYPLFGAMDLRNGGAIQEVLAARGGVFGAVIDSSLAARLELAPGDRLRIGEAEVEVRDIIVKEPDRAVSFASFGPRVMISTAALPETGLVQRGSLIRFHYRIALESDVAGADWIERTNAKFPDAGWRIRGVDRAAPGFDRFISRVTQFLTLVGLTALLVGGVGIANAVRSFLDRRMATIATLKCLGASTSTVFTAYFIQIMAVASVGIGIGLLFGAVAPLIAGRLVSGMLPFEVPGGIYWGPLLGAGAFGYLTTIAFSLWPLGRAGSVRAAQLFRALIVPPGGRPPRRYILWSAVSAVALAALVLVTTDDPKLAGSFIAGAVGVLLLFGGGALLVVRAARAVPAPKRPDLRLAVANLHRPGAPTASVILSLGLGLTVLVAIALVEANLSRQLREQLPEMAPSYFFIDIQPHQVEDFITTVESVPGIGKMERTPMVRGRIVEIAGVPAGERKVDPDVQWTINGDRGLTYAATPPPGTDLVEGEWWPSDYEGPPLLSFDAEIARGYGIGIGDTIKLNVLGREITATVHNLRNIEWQSLGMNFVFVFAPGTLEAAPHSIISTVYADTPEAEEAVQRAVTDRFPNVSAIRVKDALENAGRIMDAVGIAIRITASVTLLAGVLVLAGAVISGHQRRIYDAVVLKVLGATRRKVLTAYVMEYGLLGLATSLVSALIGTVIGYLVIALLMRADFAFDTVSVVATAALSTLLTIGLGLVGTWSALSQKAAPLLRNE